MSKTLAELVDTKTQAEAFDDLLTALKAVGFPTTGWGTTSVPRRILWALAGAWAAITVLIAFIAAGGLVKLATGDWLDLLADQNYDEPRTLAGFAEGTFWIGDNASAGPYTITAGQLWFTTANGYRFTNTAGGTLDLDGVLSLPMIAEFAGAGHNVAEGAVTELSTPLPGVGYANHTDPLNTGTGGMTLIASGTPASEYDFDLEVTTSGAPGTTGVFRWRANGGAWTSSVPMPASPTLLGATGVYVEFPDARYTTLDTFTWSSGATSYNPTPDWLTTPGVDDESDETLREACRTKWATLSVADPDDWWVYHCQHEPTYGATITRVLVENGMSHTPPVAGVVDLYLATSTGAPTGTAITAIQAYMTPRIPSCVLATVYAATNVNVTVQAVLYVRTGKATAAEAEAAATLALQDYFEGIGIGETCYLDGITQALIYDPTIVRNVLMIDPTTDTTSSDHEIPYLLSVSLSTVFV